LTTHDGDDDEEEAKTFKGIFIRDFNLSTHVQFGIFIVIFAC
jgi:hypothetical protein